MNFTEMKNTIIDWVNQEHGLNVELVEESPLKSEYGECYPADIEEGLFLIRLNQERCRENPKFMFNVLCHELGHCISMSLNGYPDSLTSAIDEESRADLYGRGLWSTEFDSETYFATSEDEERNAIRLKLYTEYFGGES